MTNFTDIRDFLRAHCARYPELALQDVFKALYQRAFGCEHLIADPSAAADYIRAEAARSGDRISALVALLGGDYCRVHLGILQDGLSAETFARLFALSARHEECGREKLEAMLTALQTMADAGELPFSAQETAEAVERWRKDGFPPLHHSEIFRQNYAPAYRVLRRDFARALPLFARIDRLAAERSRVLVAIEGGSAPDLIMEGPERLVANWGAKGVMAPLNALWTDDAKKDIYESVNSACHNEKGDYYEYPLCMTAHCMAVNMTKVKEVGADKYIDTDKHTWSTEGFLNTVDALYKGGYANVLDELWIVCKQYNADMVLMYDQISCKGMDGLRGVFEEQAAARGVHMPWVAQDLLDSRTISKRDMRRQVNLYMQTVMGEEPVRPDLVDFDDALTW